MIRTALLFLYCLVRVILAVFVLKIEKNEIGKL